jgi:hypothetical protein
VKTEGDSKRKLSDRKDQGASVGCYILHTDAAPHPQPALANVVARTAA